MLMQRSPSLKFKLDFFMNWATTFGIHTYSIYWTAFLLYQLPPTSTCWLGTMTWLLSAEEWRFIASIPRV
jgi:hypothetical protein